MYINRHGFVFVPILFQRNLRVQKGAIFPDEFTLHVSDFIFDVGIASRRGIIENAVFDFDALALGFRKETVFQLALFLDADHVLCDSAQHIVTFSNIDNHAVISLVILIFSQFQICLNCVKVVFVRTLITAIFA